MGNLKQIPSGLKIIEIISTVMAVIAVLSILYAILALFNNSYQYVSAIMMSIGCCTSYAVLSALYYIAKAACIYIEKNEKEEE